MPLQRWIAEITGAYVPIARRDRPSGAKARDFSSWNGGWVHAVDDFGELKLGL